MALTRSDDPLVWIDCEMTGLDHTTDTILSLSCFITTANLDLIEPQGYHCVIQHTQSQLSSMSPWCIQHHGASGLTQECLASTTTADTAAAELLAYIKTHVPQAKRALLAGNSIHADKMFLASRRSSCSSSPSSPWQPVLDYLHYRLFDVSACKEMVRRWCPLDVLHAVPRKQLQHTAREDVLESIDEARFYMALLRGVTLSSDRIAINRQTEDKIPHIYLN
ncbi:hypothetical protein DV738_g5504, partial [Chaetothyriales sp. CBS 135597]